MNKQIVRILLLFIFLPLVLGCGDNKVAGTSTTTENTIAGTIVYEGRGLMNARVLLRRTQALPDTNGEIQNEAVTDSAGHFILHAVSGSNYTLYAKGQNIKQGSVICYKTNIDFMIHSHALNLDTLVSKNASRVKGIVIDSNQLMAKLSIGMLGTNQFVKVDSSGAFELADLAEGKNQLVVFSTENQNAQYILKDVELQSDTKLTLDPIHLPKGWAQGGPIVQKGYACREPLNLIVQDSAHWDSVIDSTRLLYTIFPGVHPKLIEINLCLGIWNSKIDLLPGFAHFVQLFQFNSIFYAYDAGQQEFQRINLMTKQIDTVLYPYNMAFVASTKTNIVAGFHNDPWLRIFNSSENFLKKISQDSVPNSVNTIQHMTLKNETALFLGPGFLNRYSFTTKSLDTTFHPLIPNQNWNGLATTLRGTTFLLGNHNQLFLLNTQSTSILDTITIQADSSFQGLTAPSL